MDRKKVNIYLFYAIALLQGMVFYAPIATLYRQARGLSVFDITVIESISLVVMLLLEVPWGYIADRIGYKKTIIICNLLFFVSKVVFWKANNFGAFLAERLILSLVLSGLSGCDSAYLYISAGENESQKVFGTYRTMGAVGMIAASVLYSAFVKSNYELAAFLTIATYSGAMLLSFPLQEVKQEVHERTYFLQQVRSYGAAFIKNRRFVLFLIAAALMVESNQTITVFLNQLQYLRSGIQPQYMGYIYILVAMAGMLSAFSYKLVEWIGEPLAISLLFGLAGLSCALMVVTANPVLSVLCMVALRLSASLFAPVCMDIQNRQVLISDRATMLSVYSIIMNMLAVGTNLAFGKAADINIAYAMALGSFFCFAGLILYRRWEMLKRSNRAW